jgi:hypothetical protein
VSQPETQIDYYVIYQKPGDPSWYTFDQTLALFQHARKHGPYNSTMDLAEAEAAAKGLIEGTVFTDSRPEYRHKVSASRVLQLVHVGTDVITYGTPLGDD